MYKTLTPEDWIAQWMDSNGKHIRRRFSIADHGYDLAFEMACKVRQQAIEHLNSYDNMNYTERHGQ